MLLLRISFWACIIVAALFIGILIRDARRAREAAEEDRQYRRRWSKWAVVTDLKKG